MKTGIRNPKRNHAKEIGKSSWYSYYASYSTDFVRDIIQHIELPEEAVIVDPWNGSGTTTEVAQELGYYGIGFDINPVMAIIAKARQLRQDVAPSLLSILEEIQEKAMKSKSGYLLSDALHTWLQPGTANSLRNIDTAIQQLLIKKTFNGPLYKIDMGNISSLCAFFYVALFRVTKELLKPFKSSNPTWIKIPKDGEPRLYYSRQEILDMFHNEVVNMTEGIKNPGVVFTKIRTKASTIRVADSLNLPLIDNVVDAVITSPPYCTRIDYAIATLPELAICGLSIADQLRSFRKTMIGTPTIVKGDFEIKSAWGERCGRLLDTLYHHSSKASQSYYYKTYIQYFSSVYNSLREIDRVTKQNGTCVFVVQDSYYKDIHVDLPVIFEEMAGSLSWKLRSKFDYVKSHTLAGINHKSLVYRKTGMAVESVLIFKKD